MGVNTSSGIIIPDTESLTKEIANTVKTQTMKTKKLYDTNMEVLTLVLTELQHRNIKLFETQSLLYKFVEEIKFPHTISWRHRNTNMFGRKPFYSQANYDPVVNWLLDRKVITRLPESNVIKYTVNKSMLANLKDLSPTYFTNNQNG